MHIGNSLCYYYPSFERIIKETPIYCFTKTSHLLIFKHLLYLSIYQHCSIKISVILEMFYTYLNHPSECKMASCGF